MTTTRAALSGFALVAVVLAVIVGLGAGPQNAAAAALEPCETTNPTGPIVTLDGELTLERGLAANRILNRSGLRQTLIRPANNLTGRPTFPVRAVKYGNAFRVDLKGGVSYTRKKRKVSIRSLHVISKPGKPAYLRGTAGGRKINFLAVKGGKRTYNKADGELTRIGPARLTAAGAKLLSRLRPARPLRTGTAWGAFTLFSVYEVTEVKDPTGETPQVPPVKSRPLEATDVSSATTVKWFVRDSFISYVASGEGVRVGDGATADPPSGPLNLVYSFNFPFASGWTVPETLDQPENTLIKGNGLVGFQYCDNTINFTAADPEIEIDGDTNSRLIFHVNGTDGTAFPDQRAVMVKLMPSQAQDHTTVDNDDGTTTVSWVKIPGYVPAEATGIFAGLYPAFSPDFDGQDPRPDRFGFFSVTYTYANGSP